jgi:hypothetical protein
MALIPTIELAYLTETQRQAYSGSRLRTSDQLSRRDWAKSRQRANAAHSAKASTATPARQIIIAALPVTPPVLAEKVKQDGHRHGDHHHSGRRNREENRVRLPAQRFVPDSPLEEEGFEPSAPSMESSVSAGLVASVAANLHPYTVPFAPLLHNGSAQSAVIPTTSD